MVYTQPQHKTNSRVWEVIFYTFLFGMAAHAYCYFNYSPSHDGFMGTYHSSAYWGVGLGRILQPLYRSVKGWGNLPWLVGLFSLFYLALAIYLISEILHLKSRISMIALCGLFSTNISLISLYATYIYDADVYMLAFLCAVTGVFFLEYGRYGWLLSAVLWAALLGLYQAYISAVCGLILIVVIQKSMENENKRYIIFYFLKAVGTVLLAGLLYYAGLKLVLYKTGVALSTTPNGLGKLTNVDLPMLVALIPQAYKYFFEFFLNETGYNTDTVRVCIGGLLVLSLFLWGVCLRKKKLNITNLLLLVIAAGLCPLAFNAVYVVSLAFIHDLMIFSFFLVYYFVFLPYEALFEKGDAAFCADKPNKAEIWQKRCKVVLGVLCGGLILHNVIYANGAYYFKEQEYNATQAMASAILMDLERQDEYTAGETPVTCVGDFQNSIMARSWDSFEQYENVTGISLSSLTYEWSFGYFVRGVMGRPIRYVDSAPYAALPQVQQMPAFPKEGYLQMIDGAMVIKVA